MKIINHVANWIVKQATTTVNPEKWFIDYFGGGTTTKSGVRITNDNALQVATYFACVRNISEDIAKLPLITYKPIEPQGKERIKDHPLYALLHDQPNSEMTAMTFREALTSHALNWGNGYALIERDRFGDVTALWPLRPDRVSQLRQKDTLRVVYEVRQDDGQTITFNAFDIFHVHGVGFDGLVGYNIAHQARESIGAAIAAESHGAYFFKNGSNSSGVLEIPVAMSEKAKQNLKTSFNKEFGGEENTNKTIVLEEGCKFNKTSISPDDAQLLETRQFSVPEICRWFRMPPNKVGDTTRAQGWSTLEQTNTDYVVDTLLPWLTRWEQEIRRKLLRDSEKQDGVFVKHLVDALLRGDITTRYGAYSIGRQWGWLSADDIREKEEMNALPDDTGKDYLIPMNMKVAGEPDPVPVAPQLPPEPEPEEAEEDKPAAVTVIVEMPPEKQIEPEAKDDKPSARMMAMLFMDDITGRITKAELKEIQKHIEYAEDEKEKFSQWLNAFYGKHELYVTLCLEGFLPKPLTAAKELIKVTRFNVDGDFELHTAELANKTREFLYAKI